MFNIIKTNIDDIKFVDDINNDLKKLNEKIESNNKDNINTILIILLKKYCENHELIINTKILQSITIYLQNIIEVKQLYKKFGIFINTIIHLLYSTYIINNFTINEIYYFYSNICIYSNIKQTDELDKYLGKKTDTNKFFTKENLPVKYIVKDIKKYVLNYIRIFNTWTTFFLRITKSQNNSILKQELINLRNNIQNIATGGGITNPVVSNNTNFTKTKTSKIYNKKKKKNVINTKYNGTFNKKSGYDSGVNNNGYNSVVNNNEYNSVVNNNGYNSSVNNNGYGSLNKNDKRNPRRQTKINNHTTQYGETTTNEIKHKPQYAIDINSNTKEESYIKNNIDIIKNINYEPIQFLSKKCALFNNTSSNIFIDNINDNNDDIYD
jgi:hypothetical protein